MSKGINVEHIAHFLSGMTCSIHGNKLTAVAKGDSIVMDDICCPEFKKRIDDAYARQVDIQIKAKLNNLFKR